MDVADTVAVWLHALSTVVALGYYGILGRIVLPALERQLDGPALGRSVVAIERSALPLMVVAAVVFIATGMYLLLVDDQFAGLGRYLDSTWSVLMLVKHGLVGLFVVGAVIVHVLAEQLTEPQRDEPARRLLLRRLRLAAEGMTGLGALILLLTAAAQAT